MAWSIGLLIYVVVQFVAFFCVLVATPIDMFRIRSRLGLNPKGCLTLWGVKFVCSNTAYNRSSDSRWALCTPRRDRFRAAQACTLISIFVYGAAFVLGVIILFGCRWFRLVCLALNSVGAVTVCIVWVSMVVTYNREDLDRFCPALKAEYNYGAGFVLLLLAWLLDILNIPVLLFLVQDSDSGESGRGTEKKGEECEEEIKEKETQA